MSIIIINSFENKDLYPDKREEILLFKTFNISGGFCIPDLKPKMLEIITIHVKPSIVTQQVIKRKQPIKGSSLEGQKLTNCKLLVLGDMLYHIKYIGSEQNQAIKTVQTTIPFCNYIALPDYINLQTLIVARIEVEDSYIDNFDGRYAYVSASIMLIADMN